MPRSSLISTVCGSTKAAVPGISATRFRESWLRITSISRPMTCWVRAERSATVISSLSRYACPYISRWFIPVR